MRRPLSIHTRDGLDSLRMLCSSTQSASPLPAGWPVEQREGQGGECRGLSGMLMPPVLGVFLAGSHHRQHPLFLAWPGTWVSGCVRRSTGEL
jgi:hypothetical protein